MTEPQADYTADPGPPRIGPPLPIDREIETALIDLRDGHSLAALDLNDPRIAIGLGRALVRRHAEHQRYIDELAAFTVESELAQAPLTAAIDRIEARFAEHVTERRAETAQKVMAIPGVGIWSSRRQNARWEIDNPALIESLSADDHAVYTEQPPPPDRKLKRDAYIKEVLDPLLLFDDDDNEIGIDAAAPPEGVTRVAEQINVSYSLNV